eukprot:5046371-Prorocentrum_lima.AAC.1
MQGSRDLIREINWDIDAIIFAKDLGPLRLLPSLPQTREVDIQTTGADPDDAHPPPHTGRDHDEATYVAPPTERPS